KQLAKVSDFKTQSFNLPSDEEIEQLLRTAIQQAKDLKDDRSEAYALGYLGKFYEQNQMWVNARKYTEAGLNKSQSIFASNITYQWQWQLGRILKAQGDTSGAITAYTEAVNSLQDIRQNLVAIDLNLAGIKSDFQFDFQEKVEPVYRQLFDLLLSSGETENLKTAISVMELFQVAELETYLKCRLLPSNRVQKFKTVGETQQALEEKLAEIHNLDSAAALIYPIVLDNRIEVIISFPDQSIKHYPYFISKSEVEKNLYNLRTNLSAKPHKPEKQIQRDSQEVYKWLLQQPQSLLADKNVKTLVFVLDGSLRNIPMPALYNQAKKQYLVKDYVTALSPGLLQLNLKHFPWQNLKILL
ncbi:MAG TPA: CHAT domain-containing protein, partial [Phormidium sp.]